jgi:hypothetical protein
MNLRYLGLIVAVATSFATSFGVKTAVAADLGGDCCADLEERIADLESTTVRKGNRKVSLTLTGWVSEQVVYWDDGVEQNVYITGLGTAFASNFHLVGEAQIAPGWRAGYTLWVEADGCDVYSDNQYNNCGNFVISGIRGLQVLKSFISIESDKYGKVSLGMQHPADDSAVFAIDYSGTLVAAYWVAYDVFSFNVRGNFPGTNKGLVNGTAPNQSIVWGNAFSCRGYGGGPGDCDGVPVETFRYDSPVWHVLNGDNKDGGFQFVFSEGEDDDTAFALYYNALWGNLKVGAVTTYAWTTDGNGPFPGGQGAPPGGANEWYQAAIYVQHMPSGAWVTFDYGNLNQRPNPSIKFQDEKVPVSNLYYVKGGIRMKLNRLGATIPYGEYLRGEDGANVTNIDADGIATQHIINGSSTTFWGFGVVQEIDSAALSLWVRYRNHEIDLPNTHTDNFDLRNVHPKDVQTVVTGAFMAF